MLRSLFHNPADRLPTAIMVVFFIIQLTAYFFVDSLLLAIPLSILFMTLNSMSIAIGHNHCHCETFKSPALNRIYEIPLYLQSGVSPYSWIIHHVIGHHRHYLEQSKDPSPWKRPSDGSTMGRWEYVWKNSLKMYPEVMGIVKNFPDLQRKFWLMFAVSNTVLLALIVHNPVNGIIFFLVPMLLMVLNLLDATYPHHSGIYAEDEYHASRNNMHWLFNIFTWNLGYHTAHHMWPELHWTLLPDKHEEIKENIPPELILNNYFWKPNKPSDESASSSVYGMAE
ncbi:MAG: fatty acid desaturase [Pseudomonadales bacterium]|nr:fatty acid desaturase [Pseudomonadales bacterium]